MKIYKIKAIISKYLHIDSIIVTLNPTVKRESKMELYNKTSNTKGKFGTRKNKNYFTKKEMVWLLEVVQSNYLHFLWLKMLYAFGLTPTELVNIRVCDVNLKTSQIKIQETGRHRSRLLSIPKALIRDLEIEMNNKEPNSFLFQGKKGKLNVRTVQKALEKLTHRSGIYVSITKLRRTIAIHLLQLGWDENDVTELLGHSSVRTTRKLLGKSRNFYKKLKLPLDNIIDKVERKIY